MMALSELAASALMALEQDRYFGPLCIAILPLLTFLAASTYG